MAISRNESFRIQACQLADALLVWLSFWLAWETRDLVRASLGMGVEAVTARDTIHWMLYIAVPFTPLMLEHFGFYRRMRGKSPGRSIVQIAEALAIIASLAARGANEVNIVAATGIKRQRAAHAKRFIIGMREDCENSFVVRHNFSTESSKCSQL